MAHCVIPYGDVTRRPHGAKRNTGFCAEAVPGFRCAPYRLRLLQPIEIDGQNIFVQRDAGQPAFERNVFVDSNMNCRNFLPIGRYRLQRGIESRHDPRPTPQMPADSPTNTSATSSDKTSVPGTNVPAGKSQD
jgi:hypothetical protein